MVKENRVMLEKRLGFVKLIRIYRVKNPLNNDKREWSEIS